MTEIPTFSTSAARSRLLYAMQQRIVASFDEADWIEFGYFVGTPELIREDAVLLSALKAGDDGYRTRVFDVLGALCQQRSADEICRYLRLAEWLEEHDPALGQELFLTGDGTSLDDLELASIIGYIA
jgi:hypothetical protein